MTPLPLDLRDATPADEPFLRALYASTRQEELAAVEWPASVLEAFLRLQYDARAADYRRRHPGARQHLLLVDGEPAGVLWVDRDPAGWHVLDIALLPAFRGLGFGAQALRGLMADAAGTGHAVRLAVSVDNPARRLYERLGFDVTGRDEMRLSMAWTPPAPLRAPPSPISPMETDHEQA